MKARSVGSYDERGRPAGDAPNVPDATRVALLGRGCAALADELTGLRCTDTTRRPFLWRALASATDVDAVRLRPLPSGAPPIASHEGVRAWSLDFAITLACAIDRWLPPDVVVVPREALAVLLQPIVAGLLIDEGRARDLGEAEPLVLAPSAAALVDPRIDAALEERPLVATLGDRVAGVHARRGRAPAISTELAHALGARPDDEIVLHLPLGQLAIEEGSLLVFQPREIAEVLTGERQT